MRIVIKSPPSRRSKPGQSFVELAIILPVIILLLIGLVEIGFIFYAYLTVLDLTREAARFASIRDYRHNSGASVLNPIEKCTDDNLDYYYDTACFFIDPGLNPYITFTSGNFDDVAISVFTIDNDQVSDRWPADSDGVWSLFDDNWRRDCDGNLEADDPFLTDDEIEDMFVNNAPEDRGLVLVEGYYCYDLFIKLPLVSQFAPSPFRIHAYTIMPASEAIPTPTPIP